MCKCLEESDYGFLALVAMPDHVHVIFQLDVAQTVGDVVRALKGPMTPILWASGLRWQKNFFEHRLRADELVEPYLRYMLSNPYRDNLLDLSQRWPCWWQNSPELDWFKEKFPRQIPEPEWLNVSEPWLEFED